MELEKQIDRAFDSLQDSEWQSAGEIFDRVWELGNRSDIYEVEDALEELHRRGLLERSSERVDPGDLQDLVLYRRRNS